MNGIKTTNCPPPPGGASETCFSKRIGVNEARTSFWSRTNSSWNTVTVSTSWNHCPKRNDCPQEEPPMLHGREEKKRPNTKIQRTNKQTHTQTALLDTMTNNELNTSNPILHRWCNNIHKLDCDMETERLFALFRVFVYESNSRFHKINQNTSWTLVGSIPRRSAKLVCLLVGHRLFWETSGQASCTKGHKFVSYWCQHFQANQPSIGRSPRRSKIRTDLNRSSPYFGQ